ncbi:MAG: hypothetical protein DLM54_01670, partial [Acidimicrobiales bacterium]
MSSFSHAVHPLFEAMAWLLALFFGLVPNYAFAIAMLTVVVMVALSPLTLKSTRSMLAMQRLAPEIKKLQQRYKGDRQGLSEATMALYKEHGASPAGGCLPMLLQMPAFIILYDTIRGLTNTVGPHHIPEPRYISHSTALYQHLMAGHGTMMSFGIDLAKSATSIHGGLLTALPFYLLVAGSIGLQFLQMRQLTNRNPQAAAANPQMQTMQKFMPLIFGFIYISIAAGVNVYFLVSSLLRILQQELMYRYDPTLRASVGQGSVAQGSSVGKTAIEVKGSPGKLGATDGSERDGVSPEPRPVGGLLAVLMRRAEANRATTAKPSMKTTPARADRVTKPGESVSEPTAAPEVVRASRPTGRLLGSLFGPRAVSGGGSSASAPTSADSAASPGNGKGGPAVVDGTNGRADGSGRATPP